MLPSPTALSSIIKRASERSADFRADENQNLERQIAGAVLQAFKSSAGERQDFEAET